MRPGGIPEQPTVHGVHMVGDRHRRGLAGRRIEAAREDAASRTGDHPVHRAATTGLGQMHEPGRPPHRPACRSPPPDRLCCKVNTAENSSTSSPKRGVQTPSAPVPDRTPGSASWDRAVERISPCSRRAGSAVTGCRSPRGSRQDGGHAHRRRTRPGHRRRCCRPPRPAASRWPRRPGWCWPRTWSRRSTCRRSRTPRWTATRSGPPTCSSCRSPCPCLAGHPGRPHRHRAAAAGTAARIMTGAPMPPGADVIVQVERTDGGLDRVRIDSAPAPGSARPDPRRGRRGRRRRAAGRHGDRAAAGRGRRRARASPNSRSAGRCACWCCPPARELVEPGKPLGPGQIYESNAPMLAAGDRRDRRAGARSSTSSPTTSMRCGRCWTGAAGDVDLIVTSGGVSAGAYEVVKDALTGQGIEFAKVAMQPGMPQGAGRYPSRATARCRSSPCPATRSARTSRSRCSCGRRSGPRWGIRTSPGRCSARR